MQRFYILRSRFRDQQLSIFTKKCMQDKSWSKVPSLDWRLVHCGTYLPAQGWRVSRLACPSRPLWYLPTSAGLKSISAGLAQSSTIIPTCHAGLKSISASLVQSSTVVPTCQCRIEEYLSRLGTLIHYDTYLPVQGWGVSWPAWPTRPLWYLPVSAGLKSISASLAHLSTMIPTCQCRIEDYLSRLGTLIHYDTYLPVQGWRVSQLAWPTHPLWYPPASTGLRSILAGLAHSSTMVPTCQCRVEEYLGQFGPLVYYGTYLPVQGWRVSGLAWPSCPPWYLAASAGLKSISASLAHSSTMVPTCQCRVEEYLGGLRPVVHDGLGLFSVGHHVEFGGTAAAGAATVRGDDTEPLLHVPHHLTRYK